jgi:hypothetical protein
LEMSGTTLAISPSLCMFSQSVGSVSESR